MDRTRFKKIAFKSYIVLLLFLFFIMFVGLYFKSADAMGIAFAIIFPIGLCWMIIMCYIDKKLVIG